MPAASPFRMMIGGAAEAHHRQSHFMVVMAYPGRLGRGDSRLLDQRLVLEEGAAERQRPALPHQPDIGQRLLHRDSALRPGHDEDEVDAVADLPPPFSWCRASACRDASTASDIRPGCGHRGDGSRGRFRVCPGPASWGLPPARPALMVWRGVFRILQDLATATRPLLNCGLVKPPVRAT